MMARLMGERLEAGHRIRGYAGGFKKASCLNQCLPVFYQMPFRAILFFTASTMEGASRLK